MAFGYPDDLKSKCAAGGADTVTREVCEDELVKKVPFVAEHHPILNASYKHATLVDVGNANISQISMPGLLNKPTYTEIMLAISTPWSM